MDYHITQFKHEVTMQNINCRQGIYLDYLWLTSHNATEVA